MEQETRKSWLGAVLLLGLAWLATAALLHPTFWSMAQIWERSETFAHGYVILPIALWLTWRMRHDLAAVQTAPDWRALLFIVPFALGWLAARVGGVLVVEQYMLVSILIATVWLLFGPAMLRAAAFPLGYLLLMVPAGEALIPPLIEFTADFTVGAVQLIGIPVHREGTFFSLPTGDWSVVEGCSGLRYLIASFTLGTLYAYLTYRTLWKRVAFSVAAVVVPIFANGVRATMIVLIAHYSDMKLALGVDHFIYGWVWFGIVMLVMFWVGLIWREDDDAEREPPPARTAKSDWRPALALAAVLALATAYQAHVVGHSMHAAHLSPPQGAGWEREASAMTSWAPHWQGMDQMLTAHYRAGERRVMLNVAWYGAQRDGAELINSQNIMVPEKHPVWRSLGRKVTRHEVAGAPLELAESVMDSRADNQRLLVWQWQRIQGRDGISPYRAKIELTLSALLGEGTEAAAVILAAPYENDPAEARAILTAFLAEHKVALDASLDRANEP
ncbi:MAG: hypothetical protein FD187_810 [bacterium]|nr:MAG: hypothetical protein FD142_613 [bacterium]KAF0149853.1 MAG: hypothetical protein FD187_810 [bacterium]KAF0168554.1 MAG: hypothetical protein FD158_1274 [bacterium]TXT19512.1 MAG: hypothetical protein FD132_1646 [bacterium]